MSEIGSYEAKTHLAEILDRVDHGESFTITRHGRPIAELRPVGRGAERDLDALLEQARALRMELRENENALTTQDIQAAIAAGRR